MWKCMFCDKMNFDDQDVCPYCTAPNPAAQKPRPVTPAQNPVRPQGGGYVPERDWYARYGPDAGAKKPPARKQDKVLKYVIIGVSALLIVFLVKLVFQRTDRADEPVYAANAGKQAAKTEAPAEIAVERTPAPTEVPTPEPVVADATVELYLDFGQTYQCSTKDFALPYDITNADVTWSCDYNEAGTTCSRSGLICAGCIQVDTEQRYNEELIITGTTNNGSQLRYHVFTGNGECHTFGWSSGSRTMKGYTSGHVIVADPMIVQCSGFSIYFEYELTSGELNSDTWSVWVREDGKKWVRVQDISVQNMIGEVYDITFDRPITFNEVCVQPETYSQEYGCSIAYKIGYLVYN